MALIQARFFNNYIDFIRAHEDRRVDNYPLMGPSHHIMGVIMFYWLFVKHLGPKLMAKRKPFELKTAMIVYNVVQIILNFILASYGVYHFTRPGFSFRCQLIDTSGSKKAYLEAFLTYCYFALKVLDLTDTIFFVLRKKYNQISFLHVYHHLIVVIASYIGTRYYPGGHYVMMGVINCYVHVLMYFYYLLTCVRPEFKTSIWWKKKMTQVQMAQFTYLTYHFGRPLFFGNCAYSRFWLIVGFSQSIVFFGLFSNFYRKAYLKKSKKMID